MAEIAFQEQVPFSRFARVADGGKRSLARSWSMAIANPLRAFSAFPEMGSVLLFVLTPPQATLAESRLKAR